MIDRPLRPIAKESIADLQRWFPQDRSGTPTPPDTFEIGLVLAGGQSAGSYLAGVLDFLFCALDSWREALHRGGDDIPNHNVTVKVIVGASAGGLNAALAAISARYRFDYAMETAFDARAENLGSPFYRAWVSDIDISNLLATGDLREGGEAATLLNSAYLRGKVGEYIGFTGKGLAEQSTRDWLADPVQVRITTSNLDGVRYAVGFTPSRDPSHGSDAYQMRLHRDHVGFLRPLRAEVTERSIPDHDVLPLANRTGDPGWDRLGDAVLATIAVPAILADQPIRRPSTDYEYRFAFPYALGGLVYSQPFPGTPAASVSFNAFDGGVMDNEPFDLAHGVLAGSLGSNPREGELARRAIILIDPFASPPAAQSSGQPLSLAGALRGVVGALIAQARFQPIDFDLASGGEIYSRYMIAPVRRSGTRTIRGDRALASYRLSSFFGYFSEHYRHHDFMLGRLNCYRFLRDWLVLPSTHGEGGAAAASPLEEGNSLFAQWGSRALANPAFKSHSKSRLAHRQIIPLIGAAARKPPVPEWPAGKFGGYAVVAAAVEARLDRLYALRRGELADALSKSRIGRWIAGLAVAAAWRFKVRRSVLSRIEQAVDEARADIDGGG